MRVICIFWNTVGCLSWGMALLLGRWGSSLVAPPTAWSLFLPSQEPWLMSSIPAQCPPTRIKIRLTSSINVYCWISNLAIIRWYPLQIIQLIDTHHYCSSGFSRILGRKFTMRIGEIYRQWFIQQLLIYVSHIIERYQEYIIYSWRYHAQTLASVTTLGQGLVSVTYTHPQDNLMHPIQITQVFYGMWVFPERVQGCSAGVAGLSHNGPQWPLLHQIPPHCNVLNQSQTGLLRCHDWTATGRRKNSRWFIRQFCELQTSEYGGIHMRRSCPA